MYLFIRPVQWSPEWASPNVTSDALIKHIPTAIESWVHSTSRNFQQSSSMMSSFPDTLGWGLRWGWRASYPLIENSIACKLSLHLPQSAPGCQSEHEKCCLNRPRKTSAHLKPKLSHSASTQSCIAKVTFNTCLVFSFSPDCIICRPIARAVQTEANNEDPTIEDKSIFSYC